MSRKASFLGGLSSDDRGKLEKRLLVRQSQKCFICDQELDLVLHAGQVDADHVIPLIAGGPDEENNLALTHSSCNRSKGASDLRVARRMAEFDRLQARAQEEGERGANLGHLLQLEGGARFPLQFKLDRETVKFSLAEIGDVTVREARLYRDPLSQMDHFFTVLPLAYLHHDDRINPRSIGPRIRALIEEFMKKRPQLHIALGWWSSSNGAPAPVRVFDGQHKAAAQILLGVKELPIRIFVNPDTNILLQANTNAGDKLRQVAFDAAVMRHLGSSLYIERVNQYKQLKNLAEGDYSFSEKDLVTFFKGEHREMLRYIIDAVRDSITHNKKNKFMEFVEWSGKGAERPLAYNSVESSFFKEFVFKQPLLTPIDEGMERGENPRLFERDQLVRMMSLFAEVFFVGSWDPEVGGRRLESRLQKGEAIPEHHLRAWRAARSEVIANIVRWMRVVLENYFAWTNTYVDRERLLHRHLPEDLWRRLENFLRHLADLPCWVDTNLSQTIFGAKQNLDFWQLIFETGSAPNGVQVLSRPLDLNAMIQDHPRTRGSNET